MRKEKHVWIFFDLDGTLADSIPALHQVYLEFLGKFDKKGGKEEFEELNGPSLPEIVSILKARYGLVDENVSLINFYKEKILHAYKNTVKPMIGAKTVLEMLKSRGYKLSLVTSSEKDIALEFIRSQKWEQYFQCYIFGDEVKKAKPASDIYALALKRTNASLDSVVVIEDSCNGVKSAKATGAFVIGLINSQTKEALLRAGANITISSLKEIQQILEDKDERT
jgi:HAD superfamily hydrolase (TIGR01509 family)